jgi:RNA polymerase sigma-70 factor, ECF subfamily
VEPTDEILAGRAQQGDAAAFGELVERYEAKLLRYARRFLSDPEDGRDIVQDVFIKAYENLQSFDVSRRFSPWIYRIAHNEFVNELAKKKTRNTFFTIDFDTLFPHLQAAERSDSLALERDLRETLDKHLVKIDPKYREALILYYLEEMNYQEIAEVLHIPVSTVGVRLLRGRAALQKVAQQQQIL